MNRIQPAFCKAFGIDAAEPSGDVVTWSIGEELYWKPVTEKGTAFTESLKEFFADAAKREERWKQRRTQFAPLRKNFLTAIFP